MHRTFQKYALLAFLGTALLSGCALFGGSTDTPSDNSQTPNMPVDGASDAGQPTTQPPFKSELVLCADHLPDSYYATTDPVARALASLTLQSPGVFGEDYEAEPGLLTALPTFEDGSIQRRDDGSFDILLNYRGNLTWSDGQQFDPVTDVALGLSLPSPPLAPTFDVVEVQPGDASIGIRAGRDMEYPYVPFQPPLPAHVFGAQVDVSALAAEGYVRLLNPTLGPYFLIEPPGVDTLTFAVNPHFPGAESLIPTIRVRAIADSAALIAEVTNGGCDLVLDGSLGPDTLASLNDAQATGGLRLYVQPGSLVQRVLLNTYPAPFSGRTPMLADSQVRQALIYGIDRAVLAQNSYGTATATLDSWLPAGHWAAAGPGSITVYPYDQALAASLLDAAGWRDTNGDGIRDYVGAGGTYSCLRGEYLIEEGTPLRPILLIPAGDDLRARMAQQIKDNLILIGVDVQVQPLDPAQMFSSTGPITQRLFDMALFAAPVRPDPGGISRFVGSDVYRHPVDLIPVHRWELEDRWLIMEQLVETLASNNTPGPDNDYQGQNYGGWCNDAAELALVEANLVTSIPERQPFYVDHQALYTQDVPEIPLFARPIIAASAPYVCGLLPGPFDPITWNIQSWYFDETGACTR